MKHRIYHTETDPRGEPALTDDEIADREVDAALERERDRSEGQSYGAWRAEECGVEA